MLNNLRSILVVLIMFSFSFSQLNANQNVKRLNFFSKLKVKHADNHIEKKNEKINDISFVKSKKFSSEKKRGESRTSTNQKVDEKFVENFDYDVNLIEYEIVSKILISKFGLEFSELNANILKKFAELHELLKLDLNLFGIEKKELLDLFNLSGNLSEINFNEFIDNADKFVSFVSLVNKGDYENAEITVNGINNVFIKDLGLYLIFSEFIFNKQPQKAEKILSYMRFKDSNEDSDEHFDYIEALVICYLQNKDFENAKRIAYLSEEGKKNYLLISIVKYYLKVNDLDNANKIIENLSDSYKEDARVYLLDYYARNKNMVVFQKSLFEIRKSSFNIIGQFILLIYQNNFEKASTIKIPDEKLEIIIGNFIEMLASENRVEDAENFVNIFCDEDEKNDYLLFLINAYLKNNKIEDAKRLCNEIQYGQDFDEKLSKWMVSKLIETYENK